MGEAAEELPYPNAAIIREGTCLTYEQRVQLIQEVTTEEVLTALKDMPEDKAPGVDGFPVEFFKQNWELVGQDTVEAVKQFFHTGKLYKPLNVTAITLVPKVPSPTQVKDFRPIACCTTLYKLISKVLTIRLKRVINDIIGQSQSAFIQGRTILDNILFSHELFKGYGRKNMSPRCVLKVDLRKAYDTIEWSFVKSMLVELGFPMKFIGWVMECLTSVSYSLLINGGLTKPFQAKRGLRQGDPISPYLFVIAMEYLEREMKQLKLNGDFNFHPKCRKMGLTHICFADDLLMFCRADVESVRLMKEVFTRFSKASGLQANADKSSVYFAGTNDESKQAIMQILGFSEGALPFKYLGVPLSAKKLSVGQCWPLVEKIVSRIQCWTARTLSYAGRLQLIKAVLFGVQTYWAQIFLLPKKVMKAIETVCRVFLWTGAAQVSKKALVAWERVCMPYSTGGLNVINLCLWNKAAILKQLWALAMKKDCLWVKWIHSFYMKRTSIDQCSVPGQAAWVIRKIVDVKRVLMECDSLTGDMQSRFDQVLGLEGNFSIKKMYTALLPQFSKVEWKSIMLHQYIHPRYRFTMWLALNKRLATVDRLAKIGIQVPSLCVFCGTDIETFDHLFFDCISTRAIWNRILVWLQFQRNIGDWQQEVAWISAMAKKKTGRGPLLTCTFAAVVYLLWRDRNSIRFQCGTHDANSLCKEIALHVHTKGEGRARWQKALTALNYYP